MIGNIEVMSMVQSLLCGRRSGLNMGHLERRMSTTAAEHANGGA
jgi:hypothetical protein